MLLNFSLNKKKLTLSYTIYFYYYYTKKMKKKWKEKRLEEILRESESYKYSNKPMIWKFQTCFIFLIAEVSEPVQETCFTASVACKKQGQTGEKIKFNKREVYPVF